MVDVCGFLKSALLRLPRQKKKEKKRRKKGGGGPGGAE